MRSGLAALMAALLLALPASAADFDLAELKQGGYVVLLRHVTAAGADSDDLDLADCATQAEVGAVGRAQAEVLAARFEAAGIARARVLTSQWCRALQTAELLGLGPVTGEPALNYHHWKFGSKAASMEALHRFFAGLKAPAPGETLVLVSHSSAFASMAVEVPRPGGGVVLKPNGTAKPEVAGRISAPE